MEYFPGIVQDWAARLVLRCWFRTTLLTLNTWWFQDAIDLSNGSLPSAFQPWISSLPIAPEGCGGSCRHLLNTYPSHYWHPGQSLHPFAQALCPVSHSRWLRLYPLRAFEIIVLCCQQVLPVVISSLWCGDIMFLEAGLKLCQMSDRHSLNEWNHCFHSVHGPLPILPVGDTQHSSHTTLLLFPSFVLEYDFYFSSVLIVY